MREAQIFLTKFPQFIRGLLSTECKVFFGRNVLSGEIVIVIGLIIEWCIVTSLIHGKIYMCGYK